MKAILRQRIDALAADSVLARQSTLCRLHNTAPGEHAVALHKVLIGQFVSSFSRCPNKPALDFDSARDDGLVGSPIHGRWLQPGTGVQVTTTDGFTEPLRQAIKGQMENGVTVFIEALLNQGPGQPFRREGMQAQKAGRRFLNA